MIFGCKNPEQKSNGNVITSNNQSTSHKGINEAYDPIKDYQMQIDNGNTEGVKALWLKYGTNFKGPNGESFFSLPTMKAGAFASSLLESGYKMNSSDEHLLFHSTKVDTVRFSNIYLKYVKDYNSVISSLISNCDPILLNYYLRSANLNYIKKSANDSTNSGLNYICDINHCEGNSVDMLKNLISSGLEINLKDEECLVENWNQDFPMLSDSSLVAELLQNEMIKETATWTPLINYCRWNQDNIVEMLLKKGYDPNWNNSSDLLYFAITRVGDGFGEHLTKEIRNQTVELLLKSGANPHLKIKEQIEVDGEQIDFVEFASKWKFEDNTELVNIVNEYAR